MSGSTAAPSNRTGTGATTAGNLPLPIGVGLLAVVSLTIVALGSALGHTATVLGLIVASGILASIGVQISVNGSVTRTVVGVTTLWIGAVSFVGGTGVLIYHRGVVSPVGVMLTLVVAGAALLAPFGITNSMIRTYGHGAGGNVLRRYMAGTLILGLVVVGLFTLEFAPIDFADFLPWNWGGVGNATSGQNAVVMRLFTAFGVYLFCLYIVRKAMVKLPVSIFTTPAKLRTIDAVRNTVGSVCKYGMLVVGSIGAAFLVAIQAETLSGYPVGAYATTGVNLLATFQIILIAAIVSLVAVVLLVFVAIVRRVAELNGMDVVETVAPPFVFAVLLVAVSFIGGGSLSSTILTSPVGRLIRPGSIFSALVTGDVTLLLLTVATVALLLSGLVLSIPSFLAKSGMNDQSLVGIGCGVGGIIAVVIVGVYSRAGLFLIISGVAVAAFVWEFGEYSTVAVGELKADTEAGALPSGFGSLTALHAAATVAIGIVGIVAIAGMLVVAAGVTVDVTVAVVGVGACALGVAALLLLLKG